jgi:outer membrane protein insertion porin family
VSELVLSGSGPYALKKPTRSAISRSRCVLLLLLVALPLPAQNSPQTSYAAFDGQLVSSVDVAINPGADVEAVRKLIQVQAGKPFSTAAMTESVQALQETHSYSQVQVSLQPEQAGLNVLFILQPADYVGVVEFPGTGTRFPYTALLQAANVPEQSPYFESLQTRGAQGLLDYFRQHGYFLAQVQPEIRVDDTHRIVNLIFHCTLNAPATVRDIRFEGISQEQAAVFRAQLHSLVARLKRVSLKTGQNYSQSRATKSIEFIRDRLRKENRLAPTVRLASAQYDPSSNKVDVTFSVDPGPQVSIRVSGGHVSNRTLRRLIPIYEEGSVDQDLVDEGQRNLQSYFQSKGYFDVTTSSRVEKQDSAIQVVYHVSRGSKHRVGGVYFSGNRQFSDKDLKARVFVKKGFWFLHGTYSEQLLSKSVSSLKQLYQDQGFASVSVDSTVQDFNPEVDVTFKINEGPQDKVGTVQVLGNKTQSLPRLTRRFPLQLKKGQGFSPKAMERDRTQLLASYLDLGYPNADVRAAAAPASDSPHTINLTYTISEGAQAHISDVVLLGENHTKPKLIQEVTSSQVKAGQPLSEGRLLQAESNLYDLGIFDWASVRPLEPVVNQTQESVLIKVHESPFYSMDIGGGLEVIPRSGNVPVNSVVVPGIPPISLGDKFTVSQKSFVGPRFTFDIARHNLFGRAQTATIGTVLSRLDQRGFFTYADPRLHGSSWSSLLSLSAERTTENPIYTAELAQGSLQIEKALDRKHTKNIIARYSYQKTDLYNILVPGLVLPEDQHVRLSTFDGEYIRDTRDKPLDAHHGVYQTFDLGVTSKALGSSADFLRFLGQSAFYIPVKPWLVWANDFRLGLAKPFAGSDVPLSERFFSGGADSLRGFPIDGAGPQRAVPVCSNPADQSTCTLISVPVGGDMLFIFNSELRFPLPVHRGLGAAVFYDGGNVYSNINLRQFADDFTHSVGVGLRYQTPVGPVRFDVGYRLTTVPGVNVTQYFVTLGQSF